VEEEVEGNLRGSDALALALLCAVMVLGRLGAEATRRDTVAPSSHLRTGIRSDGSLARGVGVWFWIVG